MAYSFLDGNEAIARGAVAAGCRFFAGYPITPATTIFNNMLQMLPPVGGICMQGEDEIGSIGYCLGASMAGLKVMTATSGPGISLYSEQISFAVASEIPIVIVNVQRLGPSTGSATLGADGDINFMQWGNSGGLPVIVLAPENVSDCFVLTLKGFNLAERYRCPVFIASNKEIGQTRESIDFDVLDVPEIETRKIYTGDGPYLPFEISSGRKVPDFLPIGGKIPVRNTSSTHGKEGYITNDSGEIGASRVRLKEKLEAEAARFSYYEMCERPGSKILLVCYGVTSRAMREAQNLLAEISMPVSLLILKTLWPVPEHIIQEKAAGHKRIIVVEMNLGQYVREIERLLPGKEVEFFGQMDGRLITPEQIREVVRNG